MNSHGSLLTSSLGPHQYLDPYSQPPDMIPQESDRIPIDSYVIHGNGNRQEMHDHAPGHALIPESEVIQYQLGMTGSKKLLFYVMLFIITTIVLINSALIVWIMTIINFSSVSFRRLYILTTFYVHCDKDLFDYGRQKANLI